jgi:hypothetical protein
MQTVSAQSLAPGKSAELAREQIAQAAAADIARSRWTIRRTRRA